MKFQIGAMSVGDILDRGLKMLLARLPALYGINLIVSLPMIIFQLLVPLVLMVWETDFAIASLVRLLSSFILFILRLILQSIATAAILHIISQEFLDRHVDIGSAFRFALSRFGSLFGASIIAGLIIGIGSMCCIPGLIFWTWYAFVAQVVVVERLTAAASLDRSKQLGEGYRWRTLGILLLIVLLTGVVPAVLVVGLGVVLPASELVPVAGGGFRVVSHFGNEAIQILVTNLVAILFGAYQAVCLTLLYYDLRIRKEGYDLELAAESEQDVPVAEFEEPEMDFPQA